MQVLPYHPYTYARSDDPYFPIEQIVKQITKWPGLEDLFLRIREQFGSISIRSDNDMPGLALWNYKTKVILVKSDVTKWDDIDTRIFRLSQAIIFESMNALSSQFFIKIRELEAKGKISQEELAYRFEEREFKVLQSKNKWMQKVVKGGENQYFTSFPHHLLWQELTGHTQRITFSASFFPHSMNAGDRKILEKIGFLYYSVVVRESLEDREEFSRELKIHKKNPNVVFFMQDEKVITASWKKRFSWLK
jgi:hypothetical protein